jgi:hypothetical protein
MITIKNITKVIGQTCLDRKIWDVVETKNSIGEHFYTFLFLPTGDGKEWNKEVEVRLNREAREDRHYLFVMGLEQRTGLYISQQSIRNKEQLLSNITHVMSKAKHWWEHERN